MIYLLHGINYSLSTTTGLLVRPLEAHGIKVHHFDQAANWPWQSRSKRYLNDQARRFIYRMVEMRDATIVAHSQGCLQALYMLEAWRKYSDVPLFDKIYFLSPAANRTGWNFERYAFDEMRVIYNPDDLAIWLGGLLPFHRFGWAGCRGFKTEDPRVTQISDRSKVDGWIGHSHYFRGDNLLETVGDIVDFHRGEDKS